MYNLSSSDFKPRPDCSYCHVRGQKKGHVYRPNFFTFPIGKVSVQKDIYDHIGLRQCPQCRMLYKDIVISAQAQAKIYERNEQRYSYKPSNRYILRKIEIIKELAHGENLHLLDIGCHTGDFLKLARSSGFKTSGADYSDTAYESHDTFISENFYKGLIEEIQFPENSFDFITAWDVFEHFYDVKAALRNLCLALKPGGYLLLETGNISSFGARLCSPNYWWYVCGLSHFNFFDGFSVRYTLGKAGFNVIKTEKVYHKSIGELNMFRLSKKLFKSTFFHISPLMYRYTTKLMGKSGGGAPIPCKDHIFIIAQNNI